ncbi:hypothetical protein [Microbispora sp. NPDC049633]|uniref:hypothetical protein n=1 Tax=Microbispora sp. NPDC049633 TaxID=3154355 RepID=UPI00341B88FD
MITHAGQRLALQSAHPLVWRPTVSAICRRVCSAVPSRPNRSRTISAWRGARAGLAERSASVRAACSNRVLPRFVLRGLL